MLQLMYRVFILKLPTKLHLTNRIGHEICTEKSLISIISFEWEPVEESSVSDCFRWQVCQSRSHSFL